MNKIGYTREVLKSVRLLGWDTSTHSGVMPFKVGCVGHAGVGNFNGSPNPFLNPCCI